MKALILSGGHGTRLRPLTYSRQKQLIPVANRPVLFYGIDDCYEAGVRDFGIITGPNADQVEATVTEAQEAGEWPDAEFSFIHQGDPEGLAHTIVVAEDAGFLDRETPLVMYLGDNILSGGIEHLAEGFRDRLDKVGVDKVGANIMLCQVDDPTQFGVADLDDDRRVVELIEKPDEPPSDLALVGVYFFGPKIIEAARAIEPSWRGELEITDAIQWLIDEGFGVEYEEVRGWWKDTGGPRDMLGANRLVLDDLDHDGSRPDDQVEGRVIGRVRFEGDVEVDADSVIKGPAVVGDGTTIESSYVGPYTSLGPGCTLEDAEVEDSILLNDSTIRGISTVRESVLGRSVTIRPGRERPSGRRFVVGDQSTIEL